MLIIPMLKESERLFQRFAALLIYRAAGGIGYASGLAQVFVTVVQAAELRPLAYDDVHSHSVAGHLVLAEQQRARPVTVERLLHPLGIGGSVHVARAVCAVDEEKQRLLSHVLVRHPVNENLELWLTVALVLAHVVVCILPPQQVDVRCSIPVLGGQRHARTAVGLQQRRVDQVVGIDDTLGQAACHLAALSGIDNLVAVVFALLAPFAADVVNKAHAWEESVYLIIYAVCDGAAGFAEHYVLLPYAAIDYHRAHQCQCNER